VSYVKGAAKAMLKPLYKLAWAQANLVYEDCQSLAKGFPFSKLLDILKEDKTKVGHPRKHCHRFKETFKSKRTSHPESLKLELTLEEFTSSSEAEVSGRLTIAPICGTGTSTLHEQFCMVRVT
jgi:hypothetical protein